jgi:hypothetical protein
MCCARKKKEARVLLARCAAPAYVPEVEGEAELVSELILLPKQFPMARGRRSI